MSDDHDPEPPAPPPPARPHAGAAAPPRAGGPATVTIRRPDPLRPLQNLTVLAVEDSRFASEALRLLCLRSGARIRRADSLAAAERHLTTYCPDVAIIDLGLPDGNGASLIRRLARARSRVPVILGLSGRDDAREEAMAAGADGFLAKPIPSLAAFQQTLRELLPDELRSVPPRGLDPGEAPAPDLLALRDDLARAAGILEDPAPGTAELDYVAGFLEGLARLSDDPALAEAAAALLRHRQSDHAGIGRLRQMVDARLAGNPAL
ncbi:response regulator [Frigidibacter sp. MR17.24]|uniref:response regulator n=1 Tax=Frigidibacter sp. MR17.24 TaxID=3127345 RepID=UPI003012D0AF